MKPAFTEADYKAAALAAGWREVSNDPAGEIDVGPCLYHEGQDRIWPLNDWRGACEDLCATDVGVGFSGRLEVERRAGSRMGDGMVWGVIARSETSRDRLLLAELPTEGAARAYASIVDA